jgi:hypothetical protein
MSVLVLLAVVTLWASPHLVGVLIVRSIKSSASFAAAVLTSVIEEALGITKHSAAQVLDPPVSGDAGNAFWQLLAVGLGIRTLRN